jgi:hypothetical protein
MCYTYLYLYFIILGQSPLSKASVLCTTRLALSETELTPLRSLISLYVLFIIFNTAVYDSLQCN